MTKLLFYQKTGRGEVVILLHGFLASSAYWQEVIPDLEKQYTVVAIDLLGFGRSPKPKNIHYTLEDHVTAIQATLQQAIGNTTPFTLVGHSMGGLISAYYVKKYPQNIKKVILLAPPIFQSSSEAYQEIKYTHSLYRLALYTSAGRILWPLIKLSTYFPLTNHRSTRLIAQGLRYSSHQSRARSLMNVIEAHPLHTLVQQNTMPISLLVGKKDRSIYQRNLENIVKNPHITVHFVNGGHHFIHNHPEILLKHLNNRGK